jgi:hypothetical protein
MRSVVLALLFLVFLSPVCAEPGALDLPESESFRNLMSFSFQDAPVSHVLTTLFRTVRLPFEIDPCVTGEVSMEMQNVTVEEALRALARMADFTVSWSEADGRLQVSCGGTLDPVPAGIYRDPGSPTISLRFLLVRDDRHGGRQEIARPTLGVPLGMPAEISIASGPAPVFDLDEDGMPYTRSSLPSVRLKACVVPALQPYPQVLSGILEIATHNEQSESTTRTASRTFVVELPPDDSAVEVTRLRLSGKRYILTVEGRSP